MAIFLYLIYLLKVSYSVYDYLYYLFISFRFISIYYCACSEFCKAQSRIAVYVRVKLLSTIVYSSFTGGTNSPKPLGWVLSSESCAFQSVGATLMREVRIYFAFLSLSVCVQITWAVAS